MRPFFPAAIYLASAIWAGMLVGDGHVQGAPPDDGGKTIVIVVKSVKPETPNAIGIVPHGLTRDDYRRIATRIPNVRRAIPVREMSAEVRYGSRSDHGRLIGTTEAFAGANGMKVARGRFLTEKDLKRLDNVAVVNREVVRKLFLDEDPIGKSIRIDRNYFLIVGVVQNREVSDRPDVVGLQVFIPVTTIRARMGDVQISRRSGSFDAEQIELNRIEIIVQDSANVATTVDAIQRILRPFHEKPDYSVEVVRKIVGP